MLKILQLIIMITLILLIILIVIGRAARLEAGVRPRRAGLIIQSRKLLAVGLYVLFLLFETNDIRTYMLPCRQPEAN